MYKSYLLKTVSMILVFISLAILAAFTPANASTFQLTPEERAYLDSLKARPITISYSYDLVAAEFDGVPYSMLKPVCDILEAEFGLNVKLVKRNWHDALNDVETGSVDFYGPIAITESRRQKYITVDPFYRSYGKITTRLKHPINSMFSLYNRSIGLLEGSVISKTMQTYLGPEGRIIYMPSMDDMITGLQNGTIDAFATVDNAEFEILENEDIQLEFSIENFYVDQGLISGREDIRPLAELLNRYLSANPQIADDIIELRHKAMLCYIKEQLADEISYIQENYEEVEIFADMTHYPLCYLEDGEVKGMQLEINQLFEELTGVPIKFSAIDNLPNGMETAVEKLRNGECMALAGAYYNIDTWNDSAFQYSPLLWLDTIRTYSYKDTGEALTGKMLGTTRFGIDYLGCINTTGNPPVIYNSRNKMVDALKRGEIDAVFMGELRFNYGYSVLKDYSLSEVTGLSAEAALNMLYSSRSAEFNAVFNEAMTLHEILYPMSMVQWRSKSDKYKSDYFRMRYRQQIWATVIFIAFIIMLIALFLMLRLNLKEHNKTKALYKMVNENDVLTGIYNRRYMEENLNKLINALSRCGGCLSVFMIDVDFFKKYNDTYGHSMGDDCLKAIADSLADSVQRTDDFVARYGGEEFAVILPYTDEEGAKSMAEKLRMNIVELNIPHEKNMAANCVTISIGITTGTAEYTQTGMDYLKRADEALYIAKESGRNRYAFLEF